MPGDLGIALFGEQLQVVDPGARRWRRELTLGLRMGAAADHQRHRGPERPMLISHLDPRQVERVEHKLDLAAHQGGLDLVLVAVQRHRRGLGHHPLLAPQERFAQQRRGRQRRRAGGVEPL